MLKKIIIIGFLLSGFLFAQQYSNDKYEKYVGTKLGKYPLTVTGLKKAINALDSGVVYISYPGLWDTTGLGAIPSKVTLQGYLFGNLVYWFDGGSSIYTSSELTKALALLNNNFYTVGDDTLFIGNQYGVLINLNQDDYKLIFGDAEGYHNYTQFILDDNLRSVSFGDLPGYNNYIRFVLDDNLRSVKFGDITGYNNNTVILLDDVLKKVSVGSAVNLKLVIDNDVNTVTLGDAADMGYGQKILIDDSNQFIKLGDNNGNGNNFYMNIDDYNEILKFGDLENSADGLKFILDSKNNKIKLGDIDNNNYNVKLVMDESSVRLGDVDFDGSGIYGNGFQFVINPDYGWLKMGDIFNNSTGMKIELDYQDGIKIGDTDNTDNGTQIIINDSDQQILIPNMPSDSTGCVSGQLWYNKSTGAIHRKF